MSSHLGRCFVLQCGLQGDAVLARTVGRVYCPSSTATSSSGLGLAMCASGHAIGLQSGRRCVRVSCSVRSRGESAGAREDEEVELSTSRCSDNPVSDQKKWVVAALAAMVMVGAAAGGEPAMAFGWFGKPEVEKDPVEPFTIYGSIL